MANLTQAAYLGFRAGSETPVVNPLGEFVRNMLADFQQRRAVGYELGGRLGIEVAGAKAKQKIEEESPLYKAQVEAETALAKQRTRELNLPWAQAGVTDLGRNKILGSLKSGFYRSPLTNIRLPLRSKEDAIDYIMTEGYVNYEQDPQIMEILNELPSKTSPFPKLSKKDKSYFYKKYNLK